MDDHLKKPEAYNKLSISTIETIEKIAEAYNVPNAKKAMGELAIQLHRKWGKR